MSKAEMARRITDATGLTQAKATEVVETIFDEIKSALQQGNAVILRGFGSFHVRDKHGRIGRNPKTGQEAAIPPAVRTPCLSTLRFFNPKNPRHHQIHVVYYLYNLPTVW